MSQRAATLVPSSPARPTVSLLGFDVLHVVAIVPVVAEHMLQTRFQLPAILEKYHIGQIGVTLFCALSGYLALQSQSQSPLHLHWLWKRVDKLLILYGITLSAIFLMNYMTSYKPAGPGLIAAQYLGIGHFTHLAALVGQVTWFISLILLCYLIATTVRWRRSMLLVAAVAAVWLFPFDPHTTRHVLSFIVWMILAATPRRWPIGVGIVLAYLGAALFPDRDYAFPIIAVLGLFAAWLVPGQSSPPAAAASQATFEFFLVHAPICLGVSTLAKGNFVLYIVGSLLLCVIATRALQVGTILTRVALQRAASILIVPRVVELCGSRPSQLRQLP